MQTDNIALNTEVIGAEVIHIYDTLSLHNDCLMFAYYFPVFRFDKENLLSIQTGVGRKQSDMLIT